MSQSGEFSYFLISFIELYQHGNEGNIAVSLFVQPNIHDLHLLVVAIQSRISLSAKTSWQDVHLCLASGHVVVEVVAPGHVVVVVVVATGQLIMESCST